MREEIDAGKELILRINQYFPVKAAFWLKPQEETRWRLYVASDKPIDKKVPCVRQAMDDPNLDHFQIWFIGVDHPLAQAALGLYQRYKGKAPVRIAEGIFGHQGIDDGYLYPPLPEGADQKWRGVSVLVFPEPQPEGAYRVEFWPQELQVPVGWGGQPRRVPRPAGVRVEGGRVTEYLPPEKPLADLTENDYERKALEAVKEVAGKCD